MKSYILKKTSEIWNAFILFENWKVSFVFLSLISRIKSEMKMPRARDQEVKYHKQSWEFSRNETRAGLILWSTRRATFWDFHSAQYHYGPLRAHSAKIQRTPRDHSSITCRAHPRPQTCYHYFWEAPVTANIYSRLLKLASPQPNHLLNETESNLEIWGKFRSRREGGWLIVAGRVYILADQWCGGRAAVAEVPINLKLIRISQWAS